MSEYNWNIEYVMNLTRGQMVLLINKISKRKNNEIEFQKAIHGIKPEHKGLNTHGAIPIEDVIDGKNLLM